MVFVASKLFFTATLHLRKPKFVDWIKLNTRLLNDSPSGAKKLRSESEILNGDGSFSNPSYGAGYGS